MRVFINLFLVFVLFLILLPTVYLYGQTVIIGGCVTYAPGEPVDNAYVYISGAEDMPYVSNPTTDNTNSNGYYILTFTYIGPGGPTGFRVVVTATKNGGSGTNRGDVDYTTLNVGDITYPTGYCCLININDSSLPVELSAFTAECVNGMAILHWTTQSETDNIGWNIYRAKNDDNFTNAAQINNEMITGYGTTSEPHDYIYEDEIEYAIPGDTYWYWLESIDLGGEINHYNIVAKLIIPDDYEPPVPPELPIIYGLYQNAPNQFNPAFVYQTKVFFCLHKSADVKIDVYNIKGQLIKCIYNKHAEFDEGKPKPKVAFWDGKDENGKTLSAGVYLYKLLINGKIAETKKLILMK